MKKLQRLSTSSSCVASMLFGFGGCASLSSRDKRTAVDAGTGVGAVACPVLTGGSGIETVNGAAVCGVIGREVGK